MRFFINDTSVNINNIGFYQASFLKKYKIPYLFIDKLAFCPEEINSLVSKKYYDTISGEKFCVLKYWKDRKAFFIVKKQQQIFCEANFTINHKEKTAIKQKFIIFLIQLSYFHLL